MALASVKFNVKVFEIDKDHSKLKGKTINDMIETIKENHKSHLYASNVQISTAKPSLKPFKDGQFNLYTYCYNEPKPQNYWKLYLPSELVKDDKFEVIEFSFVLF